MQFANKRVEANQKDKKKASGKITAGFSPYALIDPALEVVSCSQSEASARFWGEFPQETGGVSNLFIRQVGTFQENRNCLQVPSDIGVYARVAFRCLLVFTRPILITGPREAQLGRPVVA